MEAGEDKQDDWSRGHEGRGRAGKRMEGWKGDMEQESTVETQIGPGTVTKVPIHMHTSHWIMAHTHTMHTASSQNITSISIPYYTA